MCACVCEGVSACLGVCVSAQVKPPVGKMFLIMRRWQQCSDLHSDLFEINGKLQQAGDRQLKCANTPTPPSSIPYPSRKHSMLPWYCKHSNTHKRHIGVVGAVQADQVRGGVPVQVAASQLRPKGTLEATGTHWPPFLLHSLHGVMKMSSN